MLVGLAFFTINAVWQLYNTEIPIMLDTMIVDAVTKLFGQDFLNKFPKTTIINAIMSVDNLLALFMLPLFGVLSDRTHTVLGKRTPYILSGVIITAGSLPFVAFFFSRNSISGVFISLVILLLAMSVYRSPAVALMPDVTPKPLRSKGNAIINLMGAAGNVIIVLATLVVGKILGDGVGYYYALFIITAVIILVALAVFMVSVNENKFVSDMPPEAEEETVESDVKGGRIHSSKKKSLIFLLGAVACWYMAYGCIETNFSRYAKDVLGMTEGTYAAPMLVSMIAALICFVPLGNISSKLGRKRMVTIGLAVLFGCAFFASFITNIILLYAFFALIGISWAAINVNAYPMVVEMAKGADIGRYTGYYYTFQMAAQIITPILSGLLIDAFNSRFGQIINGMRLLFPYAAIFLVFALVAMIFVRHGDSVNTEASEEDASEDTLATDEIN